ncbi:Hsp33 family molecular chaperone HslO [Magnetospirillum molischianum]|uniref:Heat shock protein HSP33 n=1 Tax=Magnetospirillum molischianum DSM 120 TaxID=1150626 RepID=H8FW17_MAGML|nr:Hsp33 family molecular chaperone HslO [Magnetospirillum molischianum]CCG42555.1 heat shock protein HSP33 [Magnetospirillum molischianum DSM 120]
MTGSAAASTATADMVLPFTIEDGLVRGRLVRLGTALDSILDPRHNYPPAVATLLAEVCALAAALAAMLKYEGVFTLQVQGDGPVPLVVADVTSEGRLRAMARFDAARLTNSDGTAPVRALLGKGHLAFTVDQGAGTERYQGIVALEGETLADAVGTYFRQSEQLDTAFSTAVRPPADGLGWGAQAVMIQRLPPGSGRAPILLAEEAEESWRRAEILLGSLTVAELQDPTLMPEHLLYRLYHAESLCLFDPRSLVAGCRCSRERVVETLASLPADELPSLADAEGRVTVTCEFCRTDHVIPLTELVPAVSP